MEAFSSLMASTSSMYEESNTTSATTLTGSSHKEDESAGNREGGASFEIACGYDNLLEENIVLRNILEDLKRQLAASETSLDELQQKASSEKSQTTSRAGATPA